MAYKAVIFDLDGTLANTLDDIAEATNEALEIHGFDKIPVDDYRHLVGSGMKILVERALSKVLKIEIEEIKPADVEKVLGSFLEIYDKNCLKLVHLYDGVRELIEELKKRGIKMSVSTNKPQVQAEKIVSHLCDGFFIDVFGNIPDFPVKPDPTLTLKAVENFKIPKAEVLFVGDSNVDIYTAENAGLKSVGVSWGFRGREELAKAGADIIVDSAAEILDIVIV